MLIVIWNIWKMCFVGSALFFFVAYVLSQLAKLGLGLVKDDWLCMLVVMCLGPWGIILSAKMLIVVCVGIWYKLREGDMDKG